MKATGSLRERVGGVCSTEGCGRASERGRCDRCALEWHLFHRETRNPVRPAPLSPNEDDELTRR